MYSLLIFATLQHLSHTCSDIVLAVVTARRGRGRRKGEGVLPHNYTRAGISTTHARLRYGISMDTPLCRVTLQKYVTLVKNNTIIQQMKFCVLTLTVL